MNVLYVLVGAAVLGPRMALTQLITPEMRKLPQVPAPCYMPTTSCQWGLITACQLIGACWSRGPGRQAGRAG